MSECPTTATGTGGAATPSTQTGGGTPETRQYAITLTNLTAGQPLSPMVAIFHGTGFRLFEIGEPASVALERLAEGAETDALIALARANPDVATQAVLTPGPVGPGRSGTMTIDVPVAASATLRISAATMPVNTNDAIAAVNGRPIGLLSTGESITIDMLTYDVGTEANSERAELIPGPAGGGTGEGFNPARDDIRNAVHVHAGVLTADQGLAGSALSDVHRWDHPAARLVVRRVR